MKKNTVRILVAILCLIMAIGIATGSTFAWFSMNNKVLVTGMTVTTKVNNNLLIAETNAEANYGIALNQTRAGTLEPVSTINGVNFYWTSTTNVEGSGNAKTDTYVAYSEDTSLAYAAANKTNYDNEFNTNYGFDAPAATYKGVAYGYIDYAFYLKGTNADAADGKIYMNKCNLLYNGVAPTDKAYRVAVFAKASATATTTDDEVAVGNLVTILAPASATYLTAGEAVTSTSATAALNVNYGQRAIISDSIASGTTAYYKVTVRLWLEGEDNTCNNDTFADLTGDWTLDLGFTLDGNSATNAVNLIGSTGVATLAKSTVTGTAGLSVDGETAASYAFYKADGTAITNGSDGFTVDNNVLTNGGAARAVYCVVTTQKGNTYRTPVIGLDSTI